jgi:hypothetical protein
MLGFLVWASLSRSERSYGQHIEHNWVIQAIGFLASTLKPRSSEMPLFYKPMIAYSEIYSEVDYSQQLRQISLAA